MLAEILERGDEVQLSEFHPQWSLCFNPDNLVGGNLCVFVNNGLLLTRSDQMKKTNMNLIPIMM
jgi:hypothetical protein